MKEYAAAAAKKTPKTETTCIITGDRKQFKEWCKENGVQESDPAVKFISSVDDFKAIQNPKVIWYGSYNNRVDVLDIFHYLNSTNHGHLFYFIH